MNTLEEQFDSLGFAPGVVTGARTFRVDEGGWLTGVIHKTRWVSGENKAECRAHIQPWPIMYWTPSNPNPRPLFEEPEPKEPHGMLECRHGFHGYYEGSNDYRTQGEIYGVIEGYGEVVIGTRGFRAMKARIVALHVKSSVGLEKAALIAAHYPGVPWFDSFEDMVAAFPPDGSDASAGRNDGRAA